MSRIDKILEKLANENEEKENEENPLNVLVRQEEDVEKALSVIAQRFSFAENFPLKAQLSELSDREIFSFSVLLAIADRLDKLNPHTPNVLKALIDNIITLRISKRRKSRKEILEMVKGLSKTVESRLEKLKEFFV